MNVASWRWAARGLRSTKAVFAPAILTVCLAVGLYCGIGAVWRAMEASADDYFQTTGLADCWVNGLEPNLPRPEAVLAAPGVAAADFQTVTQGKVSDGEEPADLLLLAPRSAEVSGLHVVEGADFGTAGDGLWLDSAFAAARHIKPGDELRVELAGSAQMVTVQGVVMSPELVGYTGPATVSPTDHAAYGFAVVHPVVLERFDLGSSASGQLRLRLDAGTNCREIEGSVRSALGAPGASIMDRETNGNVGYFLDKIAQIRSMSVIFAGAFALLSLLTVYSALGRMVRNEATEIGTLTAMGLRPREVGSKYLTLGLLVGLLGSLLGVAIAVPVAKILVAPQQRFHSLPDWSLVTAWDQALVIGLALMVCVGSAFLAARKYVQAPPAQVLAAAPGAAQGGAAWFRNRDLRGGLGLAWASHELTRNRGRFAIATIGAFGSLVLLISALGVRESIESSIDQVFGEQYTYQTKVLLSPGTDLSALTAVDAAGQFAQEVSAELQAGAVTETSSLNVLGEGGFVHLRDKTGEHQLPAEGAVMAAHLADKLGVEAGDQIGIRPPGGQEFINVRVEAIAKISFPQGVYLSDTAWQAAGGEFTPTAFMTSQDLDNSDLPEGASRLTLEAQSAGGQEILKGVTPTVIAMIVAAMLLTIVVAYCLGTLKLAERRTEYATLRALGYGPKRLFGVINADTIPSLMLALAAGFPAGVTFLSVFVAAVSTDVRSYQPQIGLPALAAAGLMVIAAVLLVNLALLRAVMRTNLPEAVKARE